jgi:hypothetical protein
MCSGGDSVVNQDSKSGDNLVSSSIASERETLNKEHLSIVEGFSKSVFSGIPKNLYVWIIVTTICVGTISSPKGKA